MRYQLFSAGGRQREQPGEVRVRGAALALEPDAALVRGVALEPDAVQVPEQAVEQELVRGAALALEPDAELVPGVEPVLPGAVQVQAVVPVRCAPVEVWAAERVENARAAALAGVLAGHAAVGGHGFRAAAWGGFPAAADCGCWARC